MRKVITMSLSLLLLLSGCLPAKGGEKSTEEVDIVATYVAQTQAAEPKPTEPPAQPTEAPVQPTETSQPTEPPDLTAELISDANCRSGPGVNYDNIAFLKTGATGKLLGKNQQTKLWYKLELPDGKQCWLTEEAIIISGDATTLASLTTPPTPTPKPKPTWNGTWYVKQWLSAGGTSSQDFNLVMTQSGNQVTFSFMAFGSLYGATGTVSADGLRLDGFARRSGAIPDPIQFTFVIDATNYNQFRGQWYLTVDATWNGDWCGGRNNADLPVPCRNP